jgi:hypothetical protein
MHAYLVVEFLCWDTPTLRRDDTGQINTLFLASTSRPSVNANIFNCDIA